MVGIVILIILLSISAILLIFSYNYPSTNINQDRPSISDSEEAIFVNFEECNPGIRRIDVPFGSTTIKIVRKEKAYCLIEYGGEVENPAWSGFLDKKCKIPLTLGKVSFRKEELGVDLAPIEKFCQKKTKSEAFVFEIKRIIFSVLFQVRYSFLSIYHKIFSK